MRYLFPWGYARRVRLVEPSRRALKPFEVTKLKCVIEGSQGPAYVMLKFIMKSVLANWTPEQIAIEKRWVATGNFAAEDLERIKRQQLLELDSYEIEYEQ